jgi:hypothetical protein
MTHLLLLMNLKIVILFLFSKKSFKQWARAANWEK